MTTKKYILTFIVFFLLLAATPILFFIATLLEQFSKGMTTYNIGYIFVRENIDHNLDVLKNYIKETVVDVETNRYRYNKFFTPIIITDEKIYYLKVGSFISEYKHGVVEGLRVLGCDG